jgi:4-amino-4-deoxy-L-arabinose transferase-like glycosyltransferase
MQDLRSANYFADRFAIAVLAAVAIAAAFTFRDYGIGWDDYTHSQYGDLLLALYGSGFADDRAFSFVNLYKYGGGFDMVAALAAKVLPFGLFETRRLVGAAIGIIGLFVTWRLGRRLGGPFAGLAALILLAVCPLYYGHMFINAKDAPFAVAMVVLLLGVVRTLDEYPRPNVRTVALLGVGLGLAFGTRILAGVMAPATLAALLMIVATDTRANGVKAAVSNIVQFVWIVLPALALGYLVMGLLWPWSIMSPLNPLRAAEYFDTFFEKPWEELYQGHQIPVPDMPWTYLPDLFAHKLPEIVLVLGVMGFAGALVFTTRTSVAINRRAGVFVVALAAILPIAVAMVMRPALYNGVRHFIFVVPPFTVLGGLAFIWIVHRVRAYGVAALGLLTAMFIAGISLPVVELIRLHPFEYTSFNLAGGGVRRAHDKFMLDYWGLAFKQAAIELRTSLKLAGEKPPEGRKWVVAICGPQPGAEQSLGPNFETTYDQKKADFAMALGTFYCRHLQAPIMATVEREGVVYATVYDFRGRAPEPLTTIPPP